MRLPFTKMHGLGNDFVVVDATGDLKNWHPTAKEASFLQDRHFGIGGDQLLVLYPSDKADLRMAIFNADGSEVEMCGNGIRCCALFARRRNLVSKDAMTVETPAGLIKPLVEKDCVRVDMGVPVLEGLKIPVALDAPKVVAVAPPEGIKGPALPKMTCVSMGNPHAIFFVEDVEKFPLAEVGPQIERHPFFPNRINVEFATILDEKTIRMRVWERGAGITLACGTGSCATMTAASLNGLVQKEADILLDGGKLHIAWEGPGHSVFMTGPAVEVFEGVITLP